MSERGEYQVSGLGDLPQSLARERGELRQRRGAAPLQLQSDSGANKSAPVVPAGVMPIYDTLPANGGRFAYGQTTALGVESESTFFGIIFTQQVPQGRVLIAREFRVNIEGSLDNDDVENGIPPYPFEVSLYVNGNAEVFTQQIQVQALDDYYPTSLIAGPGDVITIGIYAEFGGVSGDLTILNTIANLRGDMLIINEMSTPYTGLKQTPIMVVGQ